METVLTIAGFDPSSGAGITADLAVFAAHELFGTACITALTVQSTLGVESAHAVEPAIVKSTLECLVHDLPPRGVKIGMIGDKSNILVISNFIRIMKELPLSIPIVLDPVFRSSSGHGLVDEAALAALRKELMPLATWITPNVPELAVLSGFSIANKTELEVAARSLQEEVSIAGSEGRLGILAKGGHLEEPDDLVLMPDGSSCWLAGKRIETSSTHGTGCALASAFLSRLVLGDAPLDAAQKAKEYVAGALRKAPGLGHGRGPLNLMWAGIPGAE
ncbi:MAG TPA: bifunctional hydroxymethylpyrimidine kinase/phosphomethylpyrimidine kinase [Acidobacteriaceae bacterium]|nr:bifunctional hydroxymethylpyrimidine kinase/phosphomethylpyrimidine kinase [Acidobacteriaceae bacterium]